MIYLLYGSDVQRSRQKLNEIIDEYRKKHGDLNVHHFDAEETEPEKFKEALDSGSLFSSKKLAVVKYFFESKWNRGRFYELLESIKDDPDNIVILWDREISGKEVAAIAPYCKKVQEFKVSGVGGQVSDVSIFRLGDTFFTSPRDGLRSLLELLHSGHDDFNLFAYLANHARTLITVKHHVENKKPVPSKHGIHPFVVKKASALVRSVSSSALYKLFPRFFDEDCKIKTGICKPKDSLIQLAVSKESHRP